ncbi:FAD-dependent monooxygenase [Streptomyces sp. NPDC008122]|uniref:FAD-dependent monooxygenase n=1 Tax=Streptomyces sp. NPDC008122 TaxID=3364810 RepID=UPI0036E05EB7
MDTALTDPSRPHRVPSPWTVRTSTPDPSRPRVLVAGGGIGGLATALALGRRGHDVLVLEQRPTLTESGAGVRLAPRDFRLLHALGVGNAVRERSLALDAFHVRDGSTGELLTAAKLPTRGRPSSPAHATAHRLDVYEPLLEACWELDSVRLHTDSRVIGHTRQGGTVRALLADGRTVTGDVLILTDGARPGVHHDDAQPGRGVPGERLAVYRTIVPMDAVADRWQQSAAVCWVGGDWHLSHYPLPDYRYLNLTATRHHHTGDSLHGTRVDPDEVLGAFPGIAAAARDVLTTGRHWRALTLPVRPPAADRAPGRIARVGDSGHEAHRPETSCLHQALEDAVALGDSWDASGTGVHAWLAAYDARRAERVRHSGTEHTSRHRQGHCADDLTLVDHVLSKDFAGSC